MALSLKVLELVPASNKESALALVTALGGVTALITNPLFGGMSDRTRSRFGRRRPWIVGGVCVALLGAGVMLLSSSIPLLALGWIIAQAGYNATFAALNAMLAEQVPDEERGKASGIFGAASGLGSLSAFVLAALFASNLPMMFLAMPTVAVIVVALVCLVVKDPLPQGSIPRLTLRSTMTSFLFNPSKSPSFAYLLLQRAIMQTGYTLIQAFGLYFLMLRMGMNTKDATQLTLLAGIITLVLMSAVSWGVGFIASRRGRYGPYLFVSIALMATSMILTAFTNQVPVYLVGVFLSGIAMGTYYSVDLALIMRTLPAGQEGKYLGIFNMAKTLPQSVAPAIAPLLLLIGNGDPIAGGDKNYLALYLCAAGTVLLSTFAIVGFRTVLNRPTTSTTDQEDSLT